MGYTYLELLTYLFIYSFLGWLIEVFAMALMQKRFCNRGFLNLPFCLSYGVIMDILIVMLPTLGKQYVYKFIMVLVVSSIVTFLSGSLAEYVSRKSLWQYEENNLFGGSHKKLLQAFLIAAGFILTVEMIHPLLFVCINMLPEWLLTVCCVCISLLMTADAISILYAIRRRNHAVLDELRTGLQEQERKLNDRIYSLVWNRLEKAYPNIRSSEEAERIAAKRVGFETDNSETTVASDPAIAATQAGGTAAAAQKQKERKYVFAKGMCVDKLIWVFLISAFLGDIIETLYCRLVGGVWMSRSSVIYGPFSVVWGIGAVLLTVVLRKLASKDDRYIFFAGFLIGGVYEYVCSVFTEVFFGTVFWDYSSMPLNIGGRTNVLYCIFWGILSVVWIKMIYPKMSSVIEKIPPIAGKIATWFMVVFMCCNALISVAAMLRYQERAEEKTAENVIEEFLDKQYDDELIGFIWPNMKIR